MSLLYQAKDGGILMILRIANSYINNRRYTHKRAVVGVGVKGLYTSHIHATRILYIELRFTHYLHIPTQMCMFYVR